MALSPWVRPVAYCERERYAQAVLLSRMREGELPCAPIWDDVRTLRGEIFLGGVDILYGGFPCQDISCAGNGAGLEGERSGLFFEILRLAMEIKPLFIFLENVPAIRTRGGEVVGKELAALGYDCRWDIVSAQEVGAPHLRKRWFLLATHAPYAKRIDLRDEQQRGPRGRSGRIQASGEAELGNDGEKESVANAQSIGHERRGQGGGAEKIGGRSGLLSGGSCEAGAKWWATEPDVGRVAHGIPMRVDRVRALGNAVVPIQAREAFKRLMGVS